MLNAARYKTNRVYRLEPVINQELFVPSLPIHRISVPSVLYFQNSLQKFFIRILFSHANPLRSPDSFLCPPSRSLWPILPHRIAHICHSIACFSFVKRCYKWNASVGRPTNIIMTIRGPASPLPP